jgi:hypothetical protein
MCAPLSGLGTMNPVVRRECLDKRACRNLICTNVYIKKAGFKD